MRTTIIATLCLLAPVVVADFHVSNLSHSAGEIGGITTWHTSVACPSNYFNCKCLSNGDRTGNVISGSTSSDFFAIGAGFCSMPQMNFYHQSDGTYLGYIDNGDGSVIATCYNNEGEQGHACSSVDGSTVVESGLVCYSYACNA